MKAKQFFNSGKSMKLYKKRRKNEEDMQRL
jgi:hypothetical protein